jgi:hypothetical protein
MNILEYYYNDNNRMLYIEFSTDEDGDNYYRVLKLNFEDVEYYSPQLISEDDMEDIDEDFINDLIEQYLKENDLPEELSL